MNEMGKWSGPVEDGDETEKGMKWVTLWVTRELGG